MFSYKTLFVFSTYFWAYGNKLKMAYGYVISYYYRLSQTVSHLLMSLDKPNPTKSIYTYTDNTFLNMPFCDEIHKAMDKHGIKHTKQLMLKCNNNKK